MAQAAQTLANLPLPTRERLRRLIQNVSFRQSEQAIYKLASGKMSPFYFDMKPTMLDNLGAQLLAELFLEILRETGARFVGGLEMGAVPVLMATVARSNEFDYPVQGFYVRKQAKEHGTKKRVEGYVKAGERNMIVDDVTTSGASVMQAVDAVREQGAIVDMVVTIVDREEGAKELLAKNGIQLVALFTTSDFARS